MDHHVLRPTSYVLRPTSYVLRPTSYVLRPTSYVLRPTSCALRPRSVPRALGRRAKDAARSTQLSSYGILHRIPDPDLGKSFQPEQARIAPAARSAVGGRIVAAGRQRVIDAECATKLDDLALRQIDQRR